ncbi:MAG: hypothetical protein ATN36_02435 [Epulopiscium sp. Nele67-Bin005]|nr:MAG: hypothetical protein ATN36_02435 [Epulopiscium sp. Nele67-Bin005]
MLVKHIMIPVEDLTTVKINDSVKDTLDLINSKNLLSLPVVEGKKFIGVISQKCIFEDYFSSDESKEEFLKRPISEFMRTTQRCVQQHDIVERPAKILKDENTQFIPVVNRKDEFCGIVTHKAIFTTFTNILGFGHTRLVITMHEIKGRLAKLTDIIHKQDGNIISIAEINVDLMDLREVILRVDVDDVKKLVKKIEDNGFKVIRVDTEKDLEKIR